MRIEVRKYRKNESGIFSESLFSEHSGYRQNSIDNSIAFEKITISNPNILESFGP